MEEYWRRKEQGKKLKLACGPQIAETPRKKYFVVKMPNSSFLELAIQYVRYTNYSFQYNMY